MTPVEVRAQLTDALRLDLIGPGEVLGAVDLARFVTEAILLDGGGR
jgi:hypothetical protein